MVLAGEKLAIEGGPKVRDKPLPKRALFTEEEKQAAIAVFDRSIEEQEAFGYNGPEEQAYRRDFAEHLGGGFVHTVNSGTSALYSIIGALDLEAGSEIVAPPITDAGGIMPIPLMNVVPIIADAYPGSHNMGPDQFKDVLSPRTRAVVVANIGGYPADLDPIIEIAREHSVVVIEDCAQSHGARYKGKLCGSIADFGTFSTMSGKHHATGGQGGAVFTRDEEMYWRVKRFADRGKPYDLDTRDRVLAGLNLNLTDLAAAIGRVQIGRLNGFVEARRAVMSIVIDELAGARAVTPGHEVPDTESSYWFAIFQIDASMLTVDPGKFAEALTVEGIPATTDYGETLHSRSEWFVNRRIFGKSGYPWAAPEYTGDKDPHFEVPNAVATLASTFHVRIHERYGEEEARDIARAILKVENAYLA